MLWFSFFNFIDWDRYFSILKHLFTPNLESKMPLPVELGKHFSDEVTYSASDERNEQI